MPDAEAGPNAGQIAYWNDEAGPRWVARQEAMDALLDPLMEAALARIGPAAGERVLDIGCGCGASVLSLAARVGAGGRVLGVDVSGPMLGRARERVAASGLSQVRLERADAARHPFEPGAFDLAFSRFGVMFFDDPPAAFANIRKAIAPDGRLAFICWSAPAENPWLMAPLEAARPHLPPQPPADPLAPGPFAFADPDRVRRILGDAGFSPIALAKEETPMRIARRGNLEAAARFAIESGPVSRALIGAGEDARIAAERAIIEAFRHLEGPDGVVLPGRVWVVTART